MFALFPCCREFFDWVTGSDDHCVKFSTLMNRNTGVARSAGTADGETELRAERETRGIELGSRMRWVPIQPSSIGTVTKPRVTMGQKLNTVVRRW